MKIQNFLATALLLGGMLTSCNSQNAVTVNGEKFPLEEGLYAHFNTTKGDILVKLNHELAPMTTANFIALAEGNHPEADEKFKGKPFFDGLIFHRVIPNFMIQGGDPEGSGMGGPGYQFDNETSSELSHKKGVISMANSGPNTNGSQFFITVAETKQLDGSYSVFGQVVAGQEVADAISKVETKQDRPVEKVVMNEVKILRGGKEAKNYSAPDAFSSGKEIAAKAEEEKKAAMDAQLNQLKAEMQQTESGLFYQVMEEGTGVKPNEGQKVNMNYSGFLLDGTLFDSSVEEVAKANDSYDARRPYQPFEVEVSPQAQVIQGWREALMRMKVGDKWKLLISPELGYGARGAGGVIPPNAWLIFEVEMLEIVN